MKYLLIFFILLLVGCGGREKNILVSTGKVPPMFFHFSAEQNMDEFVLNTRKYSMLMLATKAYDFQEKRRWRGYADRGGNSIALDNDNGYHIDIITSYLPEEYEQKERAIESNNINYIKNLYHKYNPTTNISIQKYGKENYFSVIIERKNNGSEKIISYKSYKFNPQRTKVKSVVIVLTYNKPNNPTLAKQYTYSDLKRRAKRMLDSLYIKDEW